ncbi:MAG: hypothetical protein ACPGVD_00290 [Flavobacteriales bacterium]
MKKKSSKRNNLNFGVTILFSLISVIGISQDSLVKKAPLKGFNIGGNYRFFAQHRMFTDPFAFDIVNDEPVYLSNRSLLIGDASQLPELTLNMGGNPSPGTSFGTDLVVWNQNDGNFNYYRNLQLGINLYGNFKTKVANIGVKAGGIHWHSMTPFTMRSFAGYNRYSVFDRNPWDPQFKDINKRYEDYYKNGAISQDTRWAQQAVQGLILDITELPFGLSFNMLYGKTQNAGSAFVDPANVSSDSTNNSFIKFYDNTIPNNVVAGSIKKVFKKHSVSLNSFNRRTYSDELALDPIENRILTTEFNFVFDKMKISGEIGGGHYKDVYKDLGIGEMVSLKVNLDKKLTKIPIELHYFRINPNVVNNNVEFVNTSVIEATSAAAGAQTIIGANGVLQQNGSAMLGMGQMANNRQGLNINTEFKIDDAIISIGNGIAKEIENKNNSITYGHAINGLTMSRFWRWSFPANVGPYDRTSVLFRNVFETLNLNDLSETGEVVNDKYFNNIEAQVKYKFNFFGKPWHVFYLGSYNSVQTKFSPITVFTEDAYIRYYSHQLESYYKIHKKVVLSQYVGWERAIANYDTEVDILTERPRNQEGIAFGLGFDYMMSKNTALYLRHRYFKFEDRNFALDKYAGHETTLEIKIIF